MTPEERVRACYQHAVLSFLSGDRMKNLSLCERLGIEKVNAAQATKVIKRAKELGYIKDVEQGRPRTGYIPFWA